MTATQGTADLPRFPKFDISEEDGSTVAATSCPCGAKYGKAALPDPSQLDQVSGRIGTMFARVGHGACKAGDAQPDALPGD